jgi:CMP-N,N'-diacetyllegionaminic acid synthase
MSLLAFIPARSGSKRIPGKNVRPFAGHPLIAYAIQGALDSGLFSSVYVTSDCAEIGRVAQHYGADWIERPVEFSGDYSPDQEWIDHALGFVDGLGIACDEYAILRPTSPFRTAMTIKRAMWQWDHASCMKAVEPGFPPEKLWRIGKPAEMVPYIPGDAHLRQSSELPMVWKQAGSLEFRPRKWSTYQPFHTQGWEGYDLNRPEEWAFAEFLVTNGDATTPQIARRPYVA